MGSAKMTLMFYYVTLFLCISCLFYYLYIRVYISYKKEKKKKEICFIAHAQNDDDEQQIFKILHIIFSYCDPTTLNTIAKINAYCNGLVQYVTIAIRINLKSLLSCNCQDTVFFENGKLWMSLDQFQLTRYINSFNITLQWCYHGSLISVEQRSSIIANVFIFNLKHYLSNKNLNAIFLSIPVNVAYFWQTQSKFVNITQIIEQHVNGINSMETIKYILTD